MRLAAYPRGPVKPSDWEHHVDPVPELRPGHFVGRTRHVSIDPAMRGWIVDRPSYLPPVQVGEVMRGTTVVEVIESDAGEFPVGSFAVGMFGVQEFALCDPAEATLADPALAPLPIYLGALGTSGLAAYFGLLEIGRMSAGATVAITGAAGGVGSIAGQIAKVHGCRVIGIAGGPEKCRHLNEDLGFDAAIDYKSESVGRGLRAAAPDGVDVFFDNVGGPSLDAGLTNLALGGTVVICGGISQYNNEAAAPGPSAYLILIPKRARMEGFVVFDYEARYPEARERLAAWLADGSIVNSEESVEGGIEMFPEVFEMLFAGANTGKLTLTLS